MWLPQHKPELKALLISYSFTFQKKKQRMAPSLTTMGIFIALVTMLWTGARAQSSCTSVLLSLAPCLNYVTGASSSPSPSCCSQLANVVQSQPQCLCAALSGGGSSLGISINQTLALQLPKACNVQTPPVSECNGKNSIHQCSHI